MESPSGIKRPVGLYASAPVWTVPPCVLIVDDDPDIRQALGDMLHTEGYRIHAVASGREAIAQASEVFTVPHSWILASRFGWACRAPVHEGVGSDPARDHSHGSCTEQNTIGPLNKGALAYITKPYRPAEIKALIRRAIEVRALAVKAESVEFALTESQERFQSVIQSSSDGMVLADDEGTLVSLNQSADACSAYRSRYSGQARLPTPTTSVPTRVRRWSGTTSTG